MTGETTKKQGVELIYALMAEAQRYPDGIALGRGDPDFATPPHIVAAAREAMARHANDYTPPEGILPLRRAIADRVKQINNVEVDPDTEVVVTNGGQEAVFLMIVAVIGTGDEILIPDPNYNIYREGLRFAGGARVAVPTLLEEDFRVDPARMRQAITERTRAMLLVSPSNPTATVIAPDDVRDLVELAGEHDLLILADDIYDRFTYDGHVHTSPAAVPGGKERSLTLNALSKSFAMTGWRLGWIVGPADLMARVKQLKAATSGATSIISQYAGLAALTGPQDAVDEMLAVLNRRRRMVMDALDAMGLRYGMPQGGQFLFADISATGLGSMDLTQRLLTEQHVMVSPGAVFGPDWDHFIRMTFLQPDEVLYDAMERMKRSMSRILARA